jgi:Lipid A 3-O-deacylase (PagL)
VFWKRRFHFPTIIVGMKRGNGFLRSGFHVTAELSLLALLASGMPLKSQSIQDQAPRLEEASTELSDDLVVLTPDVGLAGNAQAQVTATALENVSSPTERPTRVLHRDSSNIPKPSDGVVSCAVSLHGTRNFLHILVAKQTFLDDDKPNEVSKPVVRVRNSEPVDLNRNIYYKNRLEFGVDVGYLPINIPFVFDVFLGDGYTMTPLRYTLVPIFASVRWHMDNVGGWSFLRGNWDMSFTASVTAIPRGPETRYFSYIMGIRRNFVQRTWKIAPYFDGRLGLGNIDAKEPLGVLFAQGQDFTFTVNMGSGVRYNINPRYSISAGLNWMHISNLYLSEPKFANYGINVYGPMFGINMRIGKPHQHNSE